MSLQILFSSLSKILLLGAAFVVLKRGFSLSWLAASRRRYLWGRGYRSRCRSDRSFETWNYYCDFIERTI